MTPPVPVRERTRVEIVTQALGLFSHKGYEATSLQDIASAVGCTKATVLYHFDGKAGVFTAATQPAAVMLRELVLALRALPTGERCRWAVGALTELAVSSRDLVAILSEMFSAGASHPEMNEMVALGRDLARLLVDPDDPASSDVVSFALVGLPAFCRISTGQDDDHLRSILSTALGRLLLP